MEQWEEVFTKVINFAMDNGKLHLRRGGPVRNKILYTAAQQTQEGKKEKACWFYQKGACRSGSKCKYLHVKQDTSYYYLSLQAANKQKQERGEGQKRQKGSHLSRV